MEENNNKNSVIKLPDNFRVAIVHDFLVNYGGAERVLESLIKIFPEAPIYTLLYDKKKMRGKFLDKVVYASFLQKFPTFLKKRYKYLLPFMPTAPETFDLRDFDLVISSSGAWSKGIVTRLNTRHISYVHSPMRFVWDASDEYLQQQKKNGGVSFFARLLMSYVRVWDRLAADRPDFLIANSKYTQARIKKYYGRESVVIYPPVDVKNFKNSQELSFGQAKTDQELSSLSTHAQEKYFLVVSRLSPYKKIDVVVEAFNKLGLPLVIIGEGQQEKYLKKIAKENIKILGWQSDDKVREYYAGARAFIFSSIDDFGMSPVEAMLYGVPILAIRKGGALETVTEGKTGEFFDSITPEVIADGVRRLMENEDNYDKQVIIKRAQEFNEERFTRELKEYIENIWK
jgi:glycosyltransferase involved in cell wall biosynthesis